MDLISYWKLQNIQNRILSRTITITPTHWELTQGLFVFLYWKKEPTHHIPILVFHKFKINLSIHSGRQELVIRKIPNLWEYDWRTWWWTWSPSTWNIFATSRIQDRHWARDPIISRADKTRHAREPNIDIKVSCLSALCCMLCISSDLTASIKV